MTGRGRIVAIVAFAFALCPAPAGAQRHGTDWERNTPEAICTLHEFGPLRGARSLGAEPGRGHFRDGLSRRFRARGAGRLPAGPSQCVLPAHALSANSLLFAGAIAEAYLPEGRDLAAAVAYDPARPPVEARSEIEVMSLCTVRAVPAAVADLFATRPANPRGGGGAARARAAARPMPSRRRAGAGQRALSARPACARRLAADRGEPGCGGTLGEGRSPDPAPPLQGRGFGPASLPVGGATRSMTLAGSSKIGRRRRAVGAAMLHLIGPGIELVLGGIVPLRLAAGGKQRQRPKGESESRARSRVSAPRHARHSDLPARISGSAGASGRARMIPA